MNQIIYFNVYIYCVYLVNNKVSNYVVFEQWKDKFPERQIGFPIEDWDKDRELDGFLCRNHRDCRWADPEFDCQQYQIDIDFLKVMI